MRELHEIVLASVSPRRRELLESLGLRVIVVPSEIDEGNRQGFRPLELAQLHADAKAQAVAVRELAHVILAADTVVDVDGVSLGKPRDRDEAAAMLGRLAGREHLVHTAYSLVDLPGGRRLAETVTTRVRFYPLGQDEIDAYVATGDPLDKAGAYGIQGLASKFVERIEGCYFNVMGLPVALVYRYLRGNPLFVL